MGTRTTREIAQFVCDTDYKDIPSDVTDYSKALALSHLGQNIAGATMEFGRIVVDYIKSKEARAEAGVFGAGFCTSADYAALVNGNSAHAVELEDKSHGESMYSVGHWPTVFAMGEKLKRSGKDILAASILGYEVASKLNMALIKAAPGKVRSPSACCSIGNAVTAAKLLKLNTEQTAAAISLGASQVAGISRQTGSGAHVVEAGFTGRNGVVAAELAARGYTGQPDILEGKLGFGDLWSDCPEFDLPLGDDYIMKRVSIRKYSCCGVSRPNVDGLFEMIAEHKIKWEDVESVEHGINVTRLRTFKFNEPANAEQTHFSLPHITVACFLDDKKVFLPAFTEEKVHDPRWREARKKVKVTVLSEMATDAYTFDIPITITMKDGKRYHKIFHSSRGESAKHRTRTEDGIEKFMACVDFAGTFSRPKAEEIVTTTLQLDKVEDVSSLNKLLTFPDRP